MKCHVCHQSISHNHNRAWYSRRFLYEHPSNVEPSLGQTLFFLWSFRCFFFFRMETSVELNQGFYKSTVITQQCCSAGLPELPAATHTHFIETEEETAALLWTEESQLCFFAPLIWRSYLYWNHSYKGNLKKNNPHNDISTNFYDHWLMCIINSGIQLYYNNKRCKNCTAELSVTDHTDVQRSHADGNKAAAYSLPLHRVISVCHEFFSEQHVLWLQIVTQSMYHYLHVQNAPNILLPENFEQKDVWLQQNWSCFSLQTRNHLVSVMLYRDTCCCDNLQQYITHTKV